MYLLILKVTQAQQDNITHAYPHPLAQLAADMAKSVDPVETESFHPPVAEHARHLGIFCDLTMETNPRSAAGCLLGRRGRFVATRLPRTLSVLLERELPLHVAVRLAATAVLTALALVLHHPGSSRAASLRLCLGPRRDGFLRG